MEKRLLKEIFRSDEAGQVEKRQNVIFAEIEFVKIFETAFM